MKFIIDGIKKSVDPGYYIDIKFMSGDADHYDTETVGPFHKEDFELAEKFITFLDEIGSRWDYSNYDRRRFKSWESMPENAEMFISDDECRKLVQDEGYKCDWNCDKCEFNTNTKFSFEWPRDVLDLTYSWMAAYDGYKIYYINEIGSKFDVRIEK